MTSCSLGTSIWCIKKKIAEIFGKTKNSGKRLDNFHFVLIISPAGLVLNLVNSNKVHCIQVFD